MFSAVTDLVQLGFFQVKAVKFIDQQNVPKVITTWPIVERTYSLSAAGTGYKVGDQLTVEGGTITDEGSQTKFAATVSTINTATGAITALTVNDAGTYATIPGPSASLAVEYQTGAAIPATITTVANVTNTDGSDFVAVTPNSSLTQEQYDSWVQDYGSTGGGGTLGTRWPTTGFWVQSGPTTGQNTDIKVGSEVYVLEAAPEGNTYIPPGTKITSKLSMTYVSGRTFTRNFSGAVNARFETTSPGTRFTTNNPVNIPVGAKIGFRGIGALIDNTVTVRPKAWRAILETTAAVDPLSDTVGVFGNVAVATTSSTLLQVSSLSTLNTFAPVIYPGQRVISTLENGSITDFVTVVSVTRTGASTANVVLSSAQTFSQVDEPLRFVFPDDPQNWRIAIDVRENKTNPLAGPQKVEIYAGTELQLKDTGELTTIFNESGTTPIDRAGLMGAKPTGSTSTEPFRIGSVNRTVAFIDTSATNTSEGFLNRERRVGATLNSTAGAEAYPLNYLMTLTSRGIFFGLWEGNWSTLQKTKAATDNYFNWFLIQRPVNRNTGQILTTGVAPVFCINSVGYKYWKMIVREKDVLHPTQGDPTCSSKVASSTGLSTVDQITPYRVPADAHSEDNFAIINSTTQVSLTEDSKYLISLLHDLNSPRFRYTEELDMVGQTSADVCMAGNDLPMTTYSETGPRIYHAMPANNPYNSGLRIVVLKNIP
jgi:hypothetical protein